MSAFPPSPPPEEDDYDDESEGAYERYDDAEPEVSRDSIHYKLFRCLATTPCAEIHLNRGTSKRRSGKYFASVASLRRAPDSRRPCSCTTTRTPTRPRGSFRSGMREGCGRQTQKMNLLTFWMHLHTSRAKCSRTTTGKRIFKSDQRLGTQARGSAQ